MRRAALCSVALALVAVTAGCNPPGWSTLGKLNTGFWHARNGRGEPVRIASVPCGSTSDVIAPWNAVAGWPLFSHDDAAPQITFRPMTPITPPDGTRRSAWVQRIVNRDTSIRHVIIHWDPERAGELCGPEGVAIWQHELGHALGIGGDSCGTGYEGVMSYCDFPRQPASWGPDDAQMLASAGYRWSARERSSPASAPRDVGVRAPNSATTRRLSPVTHLQDESGDSTGSVAAHVEEDQEAQGPAAPFQGQPRQASQHGPLTSVTAADDRAAADQA